MPFSGTLFAAGQLLAADPTVDSAVLSMPHASMLKTGLPVDRFDVLVVAGDRTAPADDLLRSLLPACAGPVLRDDPTLPRVPLPDAACAVLLAADAAHRAAQTGRCGEG